ncbi:TraB/GumN family protein [Isachenkonia alkalipeptolytica]|uniref:TraB/GumN family protein n=1 Tax=Isachenkonia alkalipeptolytica TaxID=2565777 RepID=A0AA44BDF4_9CLOT|nr:TraB/GumN family protein [Isachenkonia alkalipeptolytica]NBG87897.1 TraB/GumN family protein [Isachenkonia alkalipeptolytica]
MKFIGKLKSSRKLRFALLVLGVFISVLGCSEETVENGRGLFYEVTGGENPVYLMGSIHIGEEEMYPLHNSIEEAFESSDVLVMEIDLDNLNEMAVAQEMMDYAMYDDESRMRDTISEETFQELLSYAQPLGIGEEILDLFRPWYGTMLLTEIAVEKSDFSQEYGVEQYFLDQKGDREVIGLESVEDQLRPFTLLSDESQQRYLEETLGEMETVNEQFREMLDYWEQGDLEYFETLRRESMEEVGSESFQQYQIAMLDERDLNMTEKIQELLENDEEETYFIVVGSLHLVGENSIVYNLEELGYHLELGY